MPISRWLGRACVAAAMTCFIAAPALSHSPTDHKDPDAIRHVMMATFDQPQARLQVEPIVVRADHAIAGWTQGERGGRALLRRKADGHGWDIVVCAGDGLKDPKLLQDAGIAHADAQALAASLAAAESSLDKALLAKFASFDGMVRMGHNGEHLPGHGANAPAHTGEKHAH